MFMAEVKPKDRALVRRSQSASWVAARSAPESYTAQSVVPF